MGHKFADILFSDPVKKLQEENGSRHGYARLDDQPDYNYLINEKVTSFLQERDSFYMASVSPDGWPYIQHRGGPKGFVRILDTTRIGFSDFSGNRQYISAGNFQENNRVSLFFMDYPNRRRLKVLGRMETISLSDSENINLLEDPDYGAKTERGFVVHVEAYDWNCPQHITPRYDEQTVQKLLNEQENLFKRAIQDIED